MSDDYRNGFEMIRVTFRIKVTHLPTNCGRFWNERSSGPPYSTWSVSASLCSSTLLSNDAE